MDEIEKTYVLCRKIEGKRMVYAKSNPGATKNIIPVQTQNYNIFLSNEVYRTEIGSVEPKI